MRCMKGARGPRLLESSKEEIYGVAYPGEMREREKHYRFDAESVIVVVDQKVHGKSWQRSTPNRLPSSRVPRLKLPELALTSLIRTS